MSISCLFFLIFVPLYFLAVEPLKNEPSSSEAKLSSAEVQNLLGEIRISYCSSEAFQWAMSFWKEKGFDEIGNLELEQDFLSEETVKETIIPIIVSFMIIKKILIKETIVLVKKSEENTLFAAIMGKF